MSEGWIQDIAALMQQASLEQMQDMELHLIGHVIEYDPTTHMCRVILPTRRAQDSTGIDQPMETGWIQVGSQAVGNGFGFQYALKGGATAQNPALGEQVQVSIQHRASGLCAVANLTYNDKMRPPGAGDGSTSNDNALADPYGTAQLQPMEGILKFNSGSMAKFFSNGDIAVYAARDLVATVQNDCNLTVLEGDLNVDVQVGDTEIITELGDTLVYTEFGNTAIVSDIGDIAVETSGGAVSVTAATEVDVNAPVVNIFSPIVNIGIGAFQLLANAYHALVTYNSHTHLSLGAPPIPQAVSGIDTTIDTAAS